MKNWGLKSALAAGLALGVMATDVSAQEAPVPAETEPSESGLYGTDIDFASENIYFLLTDRFVDGDPSNNQVGQGGPDLHTFNRQLVGPDGKTANIGYLGGDFKGVLNNADYIAEMGFTAVWMTPIVDNPDAAYTGSEKIEYGSGYMDGGKTGYHGYWATNFYRVDEHLPSENLDFQTFTTMMREKHGLKFILDIVANHGSPSYTMPVAQPEYAKIFDEQGLLVADHQNIHPEKLDPNNPLHTWFNRTTGLATLSDLDPNNPEVMDYLVNSYFKWLDQGAYAIRVDTIKEQPHYFWKKIADRIREKRPDIFMFGESFSYEAEEIATHTKPENGGYSVLDFPGREAMKEVFEAEDGSFRDLLDYLHLESGVYQNPYELVTFYDNHDMSRIDATDENFINANNWLFTTRGIPAFYYGSETGFQRGMAEHFGNRNYYGQERINKARLHPIRQKLVPVANLRKNNVSLQKGLQLNLEFKRDTASFYRIYQKDGVNQTALVILNKGDDATNVSVSPMLEPGVWRDATTRERVTISPDQTSFTALVPGNGLRVFFKDTPLSNAEVIEAASRLARNKSPHNTGQ
ncbi:MAG: alpha-amylase family glycosyl hydrolase [Pseudomonadota bacterium]